MEEGIIPVSQTDRFTFRCTSCVPCFNDCCRDLNHFLTPYDILRIKNQLGLSSEKFLTEYTLSHIGQESGLPVITLKTNPLTGFQCPFLRPEGCWVYENRPASCRLYPLARALTRSRETGLLTEQYFLIRESHCRGFEAGSEQTVRQWLESQEVAPFNEMNDLMMEIIRLNNSLRPGPLDPNSARLFRLACYDLDSFKSHIIKRDFSDMELPIIDPIDLILNDDILLLKFGLNWIRKTLFG